ncbi:hypothetical protein [Paraburkholderia youngii]|uniref:hypothetical protein n=1 Tax=Paraburkholderia youngii TaxID=2782701 RepID=UPI003D25D7EF
MKFQQLGQLDLVRQLDSRHAFGSYVIGIPDRLGRVGFHGPAVMWLNPGQHTYGLHAEGAASTRYDDLVAILDRWEALADILLGASEGRVTREAAVEAVADLERFVRMRAAPGDGFETLFATAHAAASGKTGSVVSPEQHDFYNTKSFPTLICNHGNWDIYTNARGWCAAIPTRAGSDGGCKASHFGDRAFVKKHLPVEYAAWEDLHRKLGVDLDVDDSTQPPGKHFSRDGAFYSVVPGENEMAARQGQSG